MVQASAHWLTRLDHSDFSKPGRRPHRPMSETKAGSETREINEVDRAGRGSGSQTVTSFFTPNPTCFTTVFLRLFGISASHGSWIGRTDM